MGLSLYSATFFMGLAGGVHCLAMCAAPSSAITSQLQDEEVGVAGSFKGISIQSVGAALSIRRSLGFHAGRLLGYAVLGAVSALAMDQLNWFADRTSALHSLWMLVHLGMLAWGLTMLFQARQPRWLEVAGRKVWLMLNGNDKRVSFPFFAGCLWALWPCGLLYSAVMVAALSSQPGQGAVAMLLFGVGSGLWLLVGHWFLKALQKSGLRKQGLGLRVAGAMLVALSLWAIWLGAVEGSARWCR